MMIGFELQSRYNVPINLRLQHPLDCRPRPRSGKFEPCVGGAGHLNRSVKSFQRNTRVLMEEFKG